MNLAPKNLGSGPIYNIYHTEHSLLNFNYLIKESESGKKATNFQVLE